MELDDLAFPFTRGQLDTWLAQEMSCAGTECQLGLFARVEGIVDADLREQVNCQALHEDEQRGTVFFEVDSQVFQKAVDSPAVELAIYGLSCPQHFAWAAGETESSIQHTPMPVSGRLFKLVSS